MFLWPFHDKKEHSPYLGKYIHNFFHISWAEIVYGEIFQAWYLFEDRNHMPAAHNTLAKLSCLEGIDFLKIILHNHAALLAAQPESALHRPDTRQAARRPCRTDEGPRLGHQTGHGPSA